MTAEFYCCLYKLIGLKNFELVKQVGDECKFLVDKKAPKNLIKDLKAFAKSRPEKPVFIFDQEVKNVYLAVLFEE